MQKPEYSLTSLCGALCDAIGIAPPEHAAPANPALKNYVDEKMSGKKVDRILMYNSDAIGMWLEDKYPDFIAEITKNTELELPMCSVMPSVTPVNYGTMYTGAEPAVHGIEVYEKKLIKIDTFFDALIRAGKKPALLAKKNCSMSIIYQERPMDYYIFPTIEEINAKAAELIIADKHDVIIVYNLDYDSAMHKHGPEDPYSLAAMRCNSKVFATLAALVRSNWKSHNTLLGYGMDHGCHEIECGCGDHGLDMPEDRYIRHHYIVLPKEQ